MKKIKLILLLTIFLVVFIGTVFFYKNIIYSSILSVKVGCNIISEDKLNDLNYFVDGEYKPSNDTIVIYSYSPRVVKHENIHKVQYFNNRLFGCDRKFRKFLNEVEAYTFSRLPDEVYKLFYGKIEFEIKNKLIHNFNKQSWNYCWKI